MVAEFQPNLKEWIINEGILCLTAIEKSTEGGAWLQEEVSGWSCLFSIGLYMGLARLGILLVGVADQSADIVGLASLVSMEMNELVALDVGTVKGLILMLVIRKRKLPVAACDAILDLSTTLIGRNKTREETETKNENNTGEKEQTTVKKKKQKGACSRDSNREGEKLALANQHISAIVFLIKLQHQAKAEKRRTNRRRKERLDKGEENSQPLRHRHRLRSGACSRDNLNSIS
ncbi:hypothetical protein NC653_030502 [Populus alba x Populus x berolinensis]|uniref:Uncharacterized protein n=1 Tax=Populus alba x Populus x berolinensis TaxID=444605 RepID=A0AAD6LWG8_9ROSI|nr:hypothetical protein NC653_030502 [Populus alba x Populus x berolinensis]